MFSQVYFRTAVPTASHLRALVPPCGAGPEVAAELEAHPDEASMFGLPESIKLGLGDFIFYRWVAWCQA